MKYKAHLLSLILGVGSLAFAQQSGVFNPSAIATIYKTKTESLETIPQVTYKYYTGDTIINEQNRPILQILNRDKLGKPSPSDSLAIPDQFGLDHRAYSPFPRYYAGAETLDKLFIVDKTYQLFAAYEYGKLIRWGVVSTGSGRGESARTPNGRFNFNWRERFRISSESPPGQEWKLNWVFNFHLERGIHTHEYAIPVVGAASHGCVRMTGGDAKWVYDWATGWTMKNKQVLNQGNMVIVQGEDLARAQKLFVKEKEAPRLKVIQLPPDPWAVEAGSAQQRMFDRRRARHQSSTEETK